MIKATNETKWKIVCDISDKMEKKEREIMKYKEVVSNMEAHIVQIKL